MPSQQRVQIRCEALFLLSLMLFISGISLGTQNREDEQEHEQDAGNRFFNNLPASGEQLALFIRRAVHLRAPMNSMVK